MMMSQQFMKLSFIIIGFVLIAFLGVFVPTVHAQMSHKEMLQKADEARGNAEGIQWEISMDSIEGGREQHRTLRVNARGYNSLVDTLAPANVKGQKLLMQDRNMWFSKPGLSKAVPISPRQKLMGTAANGDIASTNYAGDYKIVSTEDGQLNSEACLVMDLQAVDSRATYDRIKYWVSKERIVGLKAEFYTVSGKMFKTATFEYKNSITINDKPREFISKMIINSAIIKDDVTAIKYSKPVLKKVSNAVFNLNLLTR
ncbi:MAG: outer membrane lipoprotein-sorting protein [Deltaproteobacteria bacterium HGW-Deltaproteobacteria-2]|jgi:outer membrane lipoprotein-sorting protein|nr:MAG: outer membrane lipoprotein-sorting protein [Deltaproteobacteria bacterium HGW-Deltaproteobacteria-2]